MNDEQMPEPPLKQQLLDLQSATSPDPLPIDQFDADARSLRGAWHWLDAALQSVETDIDEKALVDNVMRAETHSVAPARLSDSGKSRRWIAVAASAALLLLAIAASWTFGPAVDRSLPQISQQVAPPPAPAIDGSRDEFAWDDSLDEQLAYAEQAIVNARLSWSDVAFSFEAFDSRLQEIQQDVEQGSL